MNDKIILSICIPTYNRAKHLKQCLDNIVCQFEDTNIKNLIEVVISDNASQDNTENIVKRYQLQFDNIKYFKNEVNIGMDENIINSNLKASGKYCWNIGDDDLIQNGALKFIIQILLKKDVALLTINFNAFIDIKKSLQKIKIKDNEEIVEYVNSAEEFYRKGYCQGILGIFILNRNLWLKTDRKNYEKYWSYYEIILKMIGKICLPLAYIKTPVLFIGQDYRWSKDGSSLFVAIYIKRLFKKLINYGYSKKFIDQEIKIIDNGIIRSLIIAKSFDLNCSIKNLSLIYRNFNNNIFYLFLLTLIFFIPNFVIKKMKKIIKRNQK